jgi:hypothetical protein
MNVIEFVFKLISLNLFLALFKHQPWHSDKFNPLPAKGKSLENLMTYVNFCFFYGC